jgi:hypothetical protein
LMLRKVAYWTVLSGGLGGYIHGTQYSDFHAGWQSGIDTTAATQLNYWASAIGSLPWYKLVPDQNHTVVTAGYGTTTGNGTGNIQTDNYVTTVRASDGSFAVAFCPENCAITVDMTKLAGPATAQWYDPTNATCNFVGGSPFANSGKHVFSAPGKNSAGDPDWLLVLNASRSRTKMC